MIFKTASFILKYSKQRNEALEDVNAKISINTWVLDKNACFHPTTTVFFSIQTEIWGKKCEWLVLKCAHLKTFINVTQNPHFKMKKKIKTQIFHFKMNLHEHLVDQLILLLFSEKKSKNTSTNL